MKIKYAIDPGALPAGCVRWRLHLVVNGEQLPNEIVTPGSTFEVDENDDVRVQCTAYNPADRAVQASNPLRWVAIKDFGPQGEHYAPKVTLAAPTAAARIPAPVPTPAPKTL